MMRWLSISGMEIVLYITIIIINLYFILIYLLINTNFFLHEIPSTHTSWGQLGIYTLISKHANS